MAYNKGLHSSGGNQRGRSYALILLITFGAALLGVMVLHRLRERRIYNLLVKQKDHQLLALQLLLQKERERTKELSKKNEEMKAKVYALRSQKMELGRTIVEMQSTMDSLKDEQKLIESAFEEKQSELKMMQEKGSNLGQGGSKIIALRENLKRKEAEVEVLKHRLDTPLKTYPVSIDDHPTTFPEIVAANGTMEAQNKTENSREKNENSLESAKYGGDDKHITNEDASKSRLTEFKDGEVTAEIKDEMRTNEELGNNHEDAQDDGGAGVTAKDIGAEVAEDREKKSIGEEKQGQLENNSHGGRQDFNAKQLSGMKRKRGHSSRTKGKRWRNIVKSKLMENNGIFENHGEVNMGNRKVYRDEKDELKDKTVGRDSDEKHFTKEDSGNHENREDGNNTTVDNTNHQVTNNGINIYSEKLRLDEMRQSEKHEDGFVQQNWRRRRINNAGQTKSNMLHEEPEELEVSDVQKQEKHEIDGGDNDEEDNNDDFFKESQSEFEDEKEEYKEEIDKSEFQSGL